jgi:hypothetical protein
MFLRKIVLALLIANLAYAAYSQGWLNALTGADSAQREPKRMSRQINASAIDVQQEQPLAINVAVANPAFAEIKVGATALCSSAPPPAEQWVIYMGPYGTKELLSKKQAELAKLAVDSNEVTKTSLPKGLSLGSYTSEAGARSALKVLQRKGVKTATVLLWLSAAGSADC